MSNGKRRRSLKWTMWTVSIPTAILFGVLGLLLEPSRVSMALYVACVLCAGASVLHFIVNDMAPEDMCANDRLAPDEQPTVETTRPVKI